MGRSCGVSLLLLGHLVSGVALDLEITAKFPGAESFKSHVVPSLSLLFLFTPLLVVPHPSAPSPFFPSPLSSSSSFHLSPLPSSSFPLPLFSLLFSPLPLILLSFLLLFSPSYFFLRSPPLLPPTFLLLLLLAPLIPSQITPHPVCEAP